MILKRLLFDTTGPPTRTPGWMASAVAAKIGVTRRGTGLGVAGLFGGVVSYLASRPSTVSQRAVTVQQRRSGDTLMNSTRSPKPHNFFTALSKSL